MDLQIDDAIVTDDALLPRMVRQCIDVLDAMPDGKLVTAPRLAELIGVCPGSLAGQVTHPALRQYRTGRVAYHATTKILYGNPDTVVEAKRRLGDIDE